MVSERTHLQAAIWDPNNFQAFQNLAKGTLRVAKNYTKGLPPHVKFGTL